jgi:hypothetical protein
MTDGGKLGEEDVVLLSDGTVDMILIEGESWGWNVWCDVKVDPSVVVVNVVVLVKDVLLSMESIVVLDGLLCKLEGAWKTCSKFLRKESSWARRTNAASETKRIQHGMPS